MHHAKMLDHLFTFLLNIRFFYSDFSFDIVGCCISPFMTFLFVGPSLGLPLGTSSNNYANTDIEGAAVVLGNGYFTGFDFNWMQALDFCPLRSPPQFHTVSNVFLLICLDQGFEKML